MELFFWANTIVFTLYTALSSTILLKMRFKLDRVSICSIFAVFLSFLIRFANWIVFKLQNFGRFEDPNAKPQFTPYFMLVDSAATTVFLLNAYFFAFEMKAVHEQIKSKSYAEFVVRNRNVKRVRLLFFALAIAAHMLLIGIVIKRFYYNNPEEYFTSPLYIVFIVTVCIRLIMDMYVFSLAARYFCFIATKRRAYYRS